MPRQASDDGFDATTDRRRFLGYTGIALGGMAGLAGCTDGDEEGESEENYDFEVDDEQSVTEAGASWEDLPDLSGELTIYSGRTEDQISAVLREIEDQYDDFEIATRYDDNETHVATIDEEGENSPADILYTQDSGTLGALADLDRTLELPSDIQETVPDSWRDPEGTWTGVSGRTRCVAFNTEAWSEDELPEDVFEYPADDRFQDEMGWRVDSGSFLAWIRAMMIEEGEDRTREYVEEMQEAGVQNYEGGSTTPDALAAGEATVGFVNHYYVGRLLEDQPDAPLGVTYTDDIGSLFNVSGAGVVDSSDDPELAVDFIRHLLATEGQEFFVEENREYAVIPSVDYGAVEVPPIDEIPVPEFDLNQLSDVEPAVDLLREAGIR